MPKPTDLSTIPPYRRYLYEPPKLSAIFCKCEHRRGQHRIALIPMRILKNNRRLVVPKGRIYCSLHEKCGCTRFVKDLNQLYLENQARKKRGLITAF